MIGFETYDISAWMIEGLTTHPLSAPRQSGRLRRGASVTARFLLPAVAMGALATYAAQPVAQWFIEPPVRVERAAMEKDVIPDLPALYWAGAVAALRNATRVEESGPPDPPPHY